MKTELYFIQLDEFDDFKVYEKYIRFITPERQRNISNFKFNIDKKLSLISELFVRCLACNKLKLNNSDIKFEKNTYGKPSLINFLSFHFNISHTRNALAVAISSQPIGVDIEKIQPFNLKIVERFFCKNELEYILSRENTQERLFYEIWTRKESYIKWIGKGLSLPLTSFDTMDSKLSTMIKSVEINDYMIAVCSEADINILDFNKLSEYQVIKIISDFIYNNANP